MGQLTGKILGLEQNINQNFAQILEVSGIDYRMIMISVREVGWSAATASR